MSKTKITSKNQSGGITAQNVKDRYGLSNEYFFVRVGNCIEELLKERIVNYIRHRFDVFK